MNIYTIWSNILRNEGEDFFLKTRKRAYKYVVYEDYILIDDDPTKRITIRAFEKALLIPNPTPGKINKAGCRGGSYIYGIITDNRIV